MGWKRRVPTLRDGCEAGWMVVGPRRERRNLWHADDSVALQPTWMGVGQMGLVATSTTMSSTTIDGARCYSLQFYPLQMVPDSYLAKRLPPKDRRSLLPPRICLIRALSCEGVRLGSSLQGTAAQASVNGCLTPVPGCRPGARIRPTRRPTSAR
jgi:hypothetical protein